MEFNDEDENDGVNNNEEGKDYSNFFAEPDPNTESAVDFLQMAQVGVAARSSNLRILEIAIKFLEKSFLWRFRTTNSKLRQIQQTYIVLSQMTEQ